VLSGGGGIRTLGGREPIQRFEGIAESPASQA
jgi:hypothetical protein